MEFTDKRITQDETEMLKRAVGARLVSIDAELAAPPDNSWNTVRMHFEDFDIDVNNKLGEVVVDEFGTIEGFGLMSVSSASKEILDIPEVSAATTVINIDEVVTGVSVVDDVADIYGDGIHVAKLQYPQAIVFKTDSEVLMLDKEVWFSEMIVIKRGADSASMLYDESVNWEDNPEEDPTTHIEFHIEVKEL